MKFNIIDFRAINDRLCVPQNKTKFILLIFINLHAWKRTKKFTLKRVLLASRALLQLQLIDDSKVILWDLGTKVGKDPEYLSRKGKHSLHEKCNGNGKRFWNKWEHYNQINIHKGT